MFKKKQKQTVQGARSPDEVKKNIGRETNILLAQGVKVSYDTWKTRLGSNNVLLIGGTGEGKSRNTIKPNVYSLPTDPKTGKAMSMIFTDPKGELYQDTAGFLEANGYETRIFNVNADGMACSDCYNPFRYITTADSLMIMVDSVVSNANGGQTPKDPHWTNSAKSMLNSICYAVYYEFPFAQQNFTTVSALLNMCWATEDESEKCDYDIWLDSLEETSPYGSEHPAIVWRRKVAAHGSEMSSIISTTQTAVRIFASKQIQRLTNVDTLALDEIGDRPTAIYLCIPTTNDTYSFLLGLMYTQLFESLYNKAQGVYSGSLPHHVILWLDEFANIGKIPGFDRKIATFRSVNISAVIVVQSPNQIETLYEKAYQDIMDNVHQTIFIGSGGQGDKAATAWVSKALGQKTIQAEQSSVRHASGGINMFGIDDRTIEHSYSAIQRPVMTQDEVYRLPPDQCIVFIKGQKPFKDFKINLDTCLNYGSDLFTEPGKFGRKLKPQFAFRAKGEGARVRTVESYRKGLELAAKTDKIQYEMRLRALAEDAEYDLPDDAPVTAAPEVLTESLLPDPKSLTAVEANISSEEAEDKADDMFATE